jgi:hypothetical protein
VKERRARFPLDHQAGNIIVTDQYVRGGTEDKREERPNL